MSNNLSRSPVGSDAPVVSLRDLVSTSHIFCRNPHLAGQALIHLLECSDACSGDMERLLQRQLKACVSCEEKFLWAASAQVHQYAETKGMDEAKRARCVLMLVHMRAMADAAHPLSGTSSVFRRSAQDSSLSVSFPARLREVDEEALDSVVGTLMRVVERAEVSEILQEQSPSTTFPSPRHVSVPDSFGTAEDYKNYHRESFTAELRASVEVEIERGFPDFSDSSPRILPLIGYGTDGGNESDPHAISRATCLVEFPLLSGDVVAANVVTEWDPYSVDEEGRRSGHTVFYWLLQPHKGNLTVAEVLRVSPKGQADFEDEYGAKHTDFAVMDVVMSRRAGNALRLHMGHPCQLTLSNVALEVFSEKLFPLVPHLRRCVAVSRFPLFAKTMKKELLDIFLNPCWWARGIHAEVECIVLAERECRLKQSSFDYQVSRQLHSQNQQAVAGNTNSTLPAIERAAENVISSRRLNHSQADVLRHVSNVFSRSLEDANPSVNGRPVQRFPSAGHVDVLTCVQGPPGTGKTRVLCSLLELLYGGCLLDGERVLVCATSNVALDCIIIQFRDILESGGGCGGLVNAWNARKEGEDVEETKTPKVVRIGRAALMEAREFEVDLVGKRSMIRNPRQVVVEANFVFATLSGCAHWSLEDVPFRVLVGDEAAQQAELDLIIPLCRPICISRPFEMIILFGDQKQLPATVLSTDRAVRQAIGRSFFERLATCLYRCNICEKTQEAEVITDRPAHLDVAFGKVFLLNTQYRCHPKISELTMPRMYEGRVIDGVTEEDRKARFHDGSDLLRPLVFIDMDTFKGGGGLAAGDQAEEKIGDTALCNRTEAHFVARLVAMLFEADTRLGDCEGSRALSEHDVVVCTFYKAQVNEVRDALSRALDNSSSESVKKAERVTVTTVDAVQGQESEVVVLSTVRSNALSGIGFLADQRRVNVAMTRAKTSLYILGSQTTLRDSPTSAAADDAAGTGFGRSMWSELLDHCASKGVIVSTDLVPRF